MNELCTFWRKKAPAQMPPWRVRLLTLLMGAFSLTLLACQRDGSLERVQNAQVLRVGYAVEAPYAFVSPAGMVSGESPETARKIAKRLGLPHIEWVQVPFESLIRELLNRRFDVIAAGLFITQERAQRVRFSLPTVRVFPGLLIPKDNPRHLSSSQILASQSDLRFAVLEGSVEQTRLKALSATPQALLAVPDAQTGRAAVSSGAVDAFALSLPTVRWMAANSGGTLQAIPDGHPNPSTPGNPTTAFDTVAFAFHPDDQALQKAWNLAGLKFLGTVEHLETIRPFGFSAEDLVTPQSLPELSIR